ncbi:MAG: hypothetical protein BWY86_00865 [Candidatus Aminicenantes bacterium ADurb.Bin508]|nr:MAG: hypothetical protein BWY86_00865 [Candidatus Aminicenantes bacterium ADurb.Bin508]
MREDLGDSLGDDDLAFTVSGGLDSVEPSLKGDDFHIRQLHHKVPFVAQVVQGENHDSSAEVNLQTSFLAVDAADDNVGALVHTEVASVAQVDFETAVLDGKAVAFHQGRVDGGLFEAFVVSSLNHGLPLDVRDSVRKPFRSRQEGEGEKKEYE